MIEAVFLIVSLVLAVLSAWLLADFLTWEFRGRKTLATIGDFSEKKDKGMQLPIVSFQRGEQTVTAPALRIDQMMYVLSRPKKGDVTEIIYREHEGAIEIRVYGFINAVAGFLLMMPLLVSGALTLGRILLVTQGVFVLIFAVLVFGGLAFIKLTQRLY